MQDLEALQGKDTIWQRVPDVSPGRNSPGKARAGTCSRFLLMEISSRHIARLLEWTDTLNFRGLVSFWMGSCSPLF